MIDAPHQHRQLFAASMNSLFERRMQLQLLLILFAGVCVAGLSALLIWGSVQNAESVVVDEMSSQLNAALTELAQQQRAQTKSAASSQAENESSKAVASRAISESVLRTFPGVEGGFFDNGSLEGYAFPTHNNPSAKTDVPAAEKPAIEDVARTAMNEGQAKKLLRGGSELVLIAALRLPNVQTVAWTMERRSHQTTTPARYALLAALVMAAIVSVGGTLRMAFTLRRGVSDIQDGLANLEKDFEYLLPVGSGELGEISKSINRMATVRRKLDEELRREDRLRAVGRTVAGFAHEIRNPLNSIRLSVQVLEQRLKRGSVQPEDLQVVLGEVDRMDALVGELLAFREKRKVHVSRQSVLPCVERCADLTQPRTGDARIRIEAHGAADDLFALVDAERLTQATLNLMLNAIEASGNGGEIVVRIERRQEQVRIEVRDSGPGLSPEQQQHIFEAFYTTKSHGTGLGLAVSRQLVREMGGELNHEESDHGAAFVISLPSVRHA